MHPADDDSDSSLPCVEAMVAGTVSLMTAWADPNPDAYMDLDTLRHLIARKIVSNLFFLQHHPHASGALRQVMAKSHSHWVGVAARAAAGVEPVAAATACHSGALH